MTQYVEQLIHDITEATLNLSYPHVKRTHIDLPDWMSRKEDEATAPVRNLPSWTSINQDMLPPSSLLNDEQVETIVRSLKELLAACNCHVVFQTEVPDRFQYEAIRLNLDQEVKVLEWNDGFFSFCKPGTPPKTCTLGEYCQCSFYEHFFDGFIEEDLSADDERALELQIEIRHIQKKYGDD